MLIEREVLVSVLKATEEGSAQLEDVTREARVPLEVVREVLRRNSKVGIVQLSGKSVVVKGEQRLKVAVRAIGLGADIERVCNFLSWAEFEDISVLAFETNGFSVKKHFRFRWSGRRWEIDILGLKEPNVISVDCKHWHRGWRRSSSMKVAEGQIERTKALAESSITLRERIGIKEWKHAYFVPLILSLIPTPFKFYEGTPIVPVLQLRDFLQEMPAHIYELTHFRVKNETKNNPPRN